MQVSSYGLSDKEFMTAVEMFINDEKEKYGFTLTNVNDIGTLELWESIKSIDRSISEDEIVEILNFRMFYVIRFSVWILHAENEVCGIIAFKNWQG